MPSTNERIVAAAKELVVSGGSESVSMRKIGDALGLSAMAVYRHFPNREALLARVADELFDEAYAYFSGLEPIEDTITALHRVVDNLVDLSLEAPHRFAFMFLEKRAETRTFPNDFEAGRSRLFSLVTAVIDDGIAAGVLKEQPSWKIALTLTATVYGLVGLHQGGRIALSDEEFRALCHDSLERLLNGITA